MTRPPNATRYLHFQNHFWVMGIHRGMLTKARIENKDYHHSESRHGRLGGLQGESRLDMNWTPTVPRKIRRGPADAQEVLRDWVMAHLDLCLGFRVVFKDVRVDASNTITGLTLVLELCFMDVRPDGSTGGTFKLGKVFASGALKGEQWEEKVSALCEYGDPTNLPRALLAIGPGAAMTYLTQTLLGTQEGLSLLGMDRYKLPKALLD